VGVGQEEEGWHAGQKQGERQTRGGRGRYWSLHEDVLAVRHMYWYMVPLLNPSAVTLLLPCCTAHLVLPAPSPPSPYQNLYSA
jgi:hypothetical protein